MVKNIAVTLRIFKNREVLEVREGRYGGGKLLYSRTEKRIQPKMVRDVLSGACYYAKNVWILDFETDIRSNQDRENTIVIYTMFIPCPGLEQAIIRRQA
jgi:hypothetical protein